MTAILMWYIIIKAMQDTAINYKAWYETHPGKILLLLIFTSVVDCLLIIKGIKYLLL